MLKTPYEYIDSRGNTDYYYLKFDDSPEFYLSAMTSNKIVEIMKRRFMREKRKDISLPIVQKLIPLNPVILYFIFQQTQLTNQTYELDINGDKIPIYYEWNQYDVEDLKSQFRKDVLSKIVNRKYGMPKTIKNPVARGLTSSGYHFITLEKIDPYNRTYWLIRTNKFGVMQIAEVSEVGTETDSVTAEVTILPLDFEMLNRISSDFSSGKFVDISEDKIIVEDIKEESVK